METKKPPDIFSNPLQPIALYSLFIVVTILCIVAPGVHSNVNMCFIVYSKKGGKCVFRGEVQNRGRNL